MPNASVGRLGIFWVRVVLDLAGSAMRERVAESPLWTTLPTRRRIARRATGCLLLTYAMGNVAYDVSEPKLSMGWLAILVTALSAIVGACLLRRRSTAVL